MRTVLCVVLSVLVPLTTGGCGAIFNGTTSSISVRTVPVNARVHVDGNYFGNAPGVVSVDSTSDHIVTVESPGYTTRSVQVKSKVSAGYVVLDCLLLFFFVFPGVIALVIDGATGAWKDATPEDVAFNMDPSQPNSQPATPTAPPQSPPRTPDAPTARWAPQSPPPTLVAPTVDLPDPPPPTLDPVPVVLSGCQYDAQCKGARICANERCVDAPTTP